MLKHKRSKQWVGPFLVVGFLVVVLGAMLFLDTRPEFERITSEDGQFRVEGELPSEIDVRVLRDEAASRQAWTAVVSDVYVVEPDDVLLPIAVTMQVPAADYGEAAYAIGFFDNDRNAWTLLDTRYDDGRDIFEAETNHFSHWALLANPTIDLIDSERNALLSDVEASLPPDANGYRVDLAYATEDGDFVVFEESADRRVCAQPVTVRERNAMTTTDRALSLRLDGVERSANVRAIVHWELGSGCSTLIDPQERQVDVLN